MSISSFRSLAIPVRFNRELLDGRWDKHDTTDAANVADLTSQGKCLLYEHPDPRIRDRRLLLSLQKRLKRQEQGIPVRIRNGFVAQYCPGFGPQVSSQVLAAIGDPFRFQNGKQVLKLAGLDLFADRSGRASARAQPIPPRRAKRICVTACTRRPSSPRPTMHPSWPTSRGS